MTIVKIASRCIGRVSHKSFPQPLFLTLCAVGLLSAVATAGMPASIVSEGMVEMNFPATADHQPSNVEFTLNGKPAGVSVRQVRFLDKPQAMTLSRPTDPTAPQASIQGPTRSMAVELSKKAPRATFTLATRKNDRGEITLNISGADRWIAGKGDAFLAKPLVAGSQETVLATSTIVLQNRASQQGLLISLYAGVRNPRMVLRPTAEGTELHIAFDSGENPTPVALAVEAISGDATLALEKTPAGAQKIAQAIAGPLVLQSDRPIQLGVMAAAPASTTTDPNALFYTSAVATTAGRAAPSGAVNTAAALPAVEPQQLDQWRWFTGTDRAFTPLLADSREAQVRFGFLFDDNSHSQMDVVIGGDIVLLENRFSKDQRLTISGRSLITGRLDFDLGSTPILNTDYYGGLAVGFRDGKNQYEAYIYHESSHLGDELITEYNAKRINYSREALRLLYSRYFGQEDQLRLYGGSTFNMRAEPSDIAGGVILQGGAEYNFDLWNIPMYLAADLKMRSYKSFYPNITAQYGIDLDRDDRHRPRIFLEFFHGYSEMGQFWDQRQTYGMVGLGYNF